MIRPRQLPANPAPPRAPSAILDTLVRTEAPEGIYLEMRPAGVIARLYAFVIDVAIRGAIVIAAAMVLAWAGGMGLGAFLIVLFLIEWFYPVVFELMLAGATPGKRMLGLKVLMDNGLPITPAASLTRNLLRAADFLPLLYAAGAMSMLWRSDFKRLGDLAAGTLVVYATPPALTPTASALPAADPQPPARPLLPAEQAAVLTFAARARRLTPERADELASLAEAVAGPTTGRPAARLFAVAQWLYGRREPRNARPQGQTTA